MKKFGSDLSLGQYKAKESFWYFDELSEENRILAYSFGSVEYLKEELIVEMGASFQNTFAGIKDANFKNSLAYLKGWFRPLQEDPKMLIYAVQRLNQVANYILGIDKEEEE